MFISRHGLRLSLMLLSLVMATVLAGGFYLLPFLLGSFYLNLGNIELSKAVLGQDSHSSAGSPRLASLATSVRAREPARLARSIDLLKQAIKWSGDSHGPFLSLGKTYLAGGEPALALAALSRAQDLAPGDSNTALELGNAYWQSGWKEKAREIWRGAGLLSEFSSPYFYRATQALEAKDYTMAEAWLKPVLELDPDDAYAHYLIGRVYLETRRWQPAIDSLQIVVKSYPNTWWGAGQSYHYLGVAYKHLGNGPAALQAFGKAVEINPGDPWSLLELGHVSIMMKLPQQAIDYYTRARDIAPNNPLPYSHLSKALEEVGLLDQAIAELQKATGLSPSTVEYHLNLAQLYSRAKHLNKAIEEYRKVLELEPQNEIALGELKKLGSSKE